MRSGHTELHTWTSADGRQSSEIEVYVPASIAAQGVTPTDPSGEAAAERALHSLRGQQALEPLAQSLLRSEGIASSRIEGEVASTRRVFEAEYAPEDVSDRQALRIVNSIRVMNDVIGTAADGLTPHDFDAWHGLLFADTPAAFSAGRVRTKQNWIGRRTDSPEGAEFIPPRPELVDEATLDLTRFVDRVDVPPITQAAIAHAQFETIHPYPDGNGRIGRALVYRSWAYRGATAEINPSISRILVEAREAYIDGLTSYRAGEVDLWLAFFFEVVQSAVSYTHALGRGLEELHEDWSNRLRGTHKDALARRLVTDLSRTPILSAADVASRYDVTERGARLALDDLAEREILSFRPLRKAKRGRPAKVYEATELFDLLDRSPQDLA
jgi:Fic family protein